ncbi:triphosphate tunel metalloenzyme 3-like protein isoform X1 [Cinnamomum micranthum f. kanehirae]|uniref:Triphosphate tunel metalloenzyme 3-like protein isoform X1 n=1 Tax=Cinnamomum micranthum f. kanehirae TaxID=337451 RepID=A0A443NDA8_9MAGN|nr:triphosphate tunel metalloenzyme 3-like protein isoform X1 [Cinnamomum micranthum f. kanehirae]
MLRLRIRKSWKKPVSALLPNHLPPTQTPLLPLSSNTSTSLRMLPTKPNALASLSNPTHNPNYRVISSSAAFVKTLPCQMEVEVKLRIPDYAAHQKLSQLLTTFHNKTHLQENVFFDGSESKLSLKRAVLCLRFYDGESLCIVCLKAKAVITDGVSRAEEDEEEIDPTIACACISNLSRLRLLDNSRILKRVREEFGCRDFTCLGGFRNVRAVHDWEGHKLKLDETQ